MIKINRLPFIFKPFGFLLFFLPNITLASVIPLSFHDFFADATAVVSADGSSATLTENSVFGLTLLSNDPGLGDPEIIVAAANTKVIFDLEFDAAAGGHDGFTAALTDSNGLPIIAQSFFSTQSVSASIELDLSTLIGQQLGLSFSLERLFGDSNLNSIATLGNLRLETVTQVAEPHMALLLIMAALFILLRRKQVR